MPDPRPPARSHPSRRMFLGGAGAAALGITALEATTAGPARAAQPASRLLAAGNAVAPRPYFPSDVTRIRPTASLPDLFTFFSPVASPGHARRVTHASQWPARAAELSDLMQYYLYGYKHPTPEDGSVFRQVPVPPTTVVNFSAVFDFSTFSVKLPAGSYNIDFSSFVVTPILTFVATQAYTAPAGFQSWAAGDTWDTPAHASLLRTTPATTKMVIDVTDPGAAGSATATITLDDFQVPKQGVDTDIAGPYPSVLVVGGLSAEQVTTLKANGYGYISMDTASVYSDWNGTTNPHTGAYTELYPYQAGVYELDSGALMGWAWGISRIVDAIKNDAEGANQYNLDWKSTAVTGVSRNGKAAALAGAFDERIAVTAPSDPGGGGLTGWRNMTESEMFTYNVPVGANQIYSLNETVQRAVGNPSEAAWFTSKAQDFLPDKIAHAPFDLHAVAALVAPRPFILWTGEAQQSWLGSPSSVLSMQAGKAAYDLLGAGGNIGWVVRDAQHANQDRDLPDLIAIMDRAFGRSKTLTRRFFASLAGANNAALDGSGVIYPTKTYLSINDMTRNPYDIENWYVQWSLPWQYTLWSEDTFVTAGMPRVLTFHTDARQVLLTLPDGSRLMRAAPRGVATFSLTAAQAQAGRYIAETRGAGKQGRQGKQIELAGFSLSDALRHGLNLTSGVPSGMAVGFASPLANYGSAADPPRMYINGSLLTASSYDDGNHQGYIERFGASLKLPGAPAGPWDGTVSFVLSIKNIKLQSLPGFTFAVDLKLKKATVPNFFGQPTDGFTSALGETPSWNSQDLQNTPLSGNFHGRWPLFPNSTDDTGARPVSVPTQTAFNTTITVSDASATGVTLRFSQPLSPNELGVGLDFASSWTTQWAADNASVRITYGSLVGRRAAGSIIVFRAVDAAGNMIGGPLRLAVR